jgi:peroxiredoxin
MESSTRKNSLTVVLLLVIVIMGLEIVYLVYQNRRLQSALTEASSLQVLEQGQMVPALTAAYLDGTPAQVVYGDNQPSTVLIWFSPSCHVCKDNADFWNLLYVRYRHSERVRFLAMSDSDPAETGPYVTQHALTFPVICVTDDRLIDAYNGRVMPQTALISPQGAIEQVWPGALEKTRQDEITAALDLLID